VVRYFGGTLLGVSGLINAYKSAAADAISNSTIITHVIENNYKLEFDYPLQNFVMRVINEEKISILNSIYEMKCTLDVGIRLSVEQSAIGKLEKIEGLKITFYS
jgi:putative IMPACT (imprinted ancient) family translation regulator